MAAISTATASIKTTVAPKSRSSAIRAPSVQFGKSARVAFKSSNGGVTTSCMRVWPPYENEKYETLSYLPPLSEAAILRQVDYLMRNGLTPCIEFDRLGKVYRDNNSGPGYYDGRYWTMWKLPMFGCSNPGEVLDEINQCSAEYPECYIRVIGFDSDRQVQIVSFLVQKPYRRV